MKLEEILKKLIFEVWWEEQYEGTIFDDDAYQGTSLLVPKSSKEKIEKWANDMKMGVPKRQRKKRKITDI